MERIHDSTTLLIFFCSAWWKIPVNLSEVMFCIWLQHDSCTLTISLDKWNIFTAWLLSCHSSVLFFFFPLLFFSEMGESHVLFTGFCVFHSCSRSPASLLFGRMRVLALFPASISHPIPLIWSLNLENFYQFYNLIKLSKILLSVMLPFFFS